MNRLALRLLLGFVGCAAHVGGMVRLRFSSWLLRESRFSWKPDEQPRRTLRTRPPRCTVAVMRALLFIFAFFASLTAHAWSVAERAPDEEAASEAPPEETQAIHDTADPHGRLTRRDANGAVTCTEGLTEPDAFCTAPDGLPFGFVGAWRSEGTGLVYLRHRWYSPALGEFISRDPLGYVDSYNPYAYVAMDPINGWDPWGLESRSMAGPTPPKVDAMEGGHGPRSQDVIAACDSLPLFDHQCDGLQVYNRSPNFKRRLSEKLKGHDLSRRWSNDPVEAGMDIWERTRQREFVSDGWILGLNTATALGGAKATAEFGVAAKRYAQGKVAKVFSGSAHGVPKGAQAAASACRGPTCICFVAGTLVLMADGTTKPIEEVQVGDIVQADDPTEDLPPEVQEVQEVHVTLASAIYSIQLEGAEEAIESTGRHPFWTQRGWVPAEGLTADDTLLDARGHSVGIESIIAESRDEVTYNLTVAEHHTFFVVSGDVSVLVHNVDVFQVDPLDILFTQDSISPTFSDGPWAGKTLGEAIEAARKSRSLPAGLRIEAIRLPDDKWATLNNRTLYVARVANLVDVPIVDASGRGENRFKRLIRDLGIGVPQMHIEVRCR